MPIRTELVDLTFQAWVETVAGYFSEYPVTGAIAGLYKEVKGNTTYRYKTHDQLLRVRDNIVWIDTPEVAPDLTWLEELISLYNMVMMQRTGNEREIEVRLCYAREAKKDE